MKSKPKEIGKPVRAALDLAFGMNSNLLKEDWQYEVANGDTVLGFAEWLQHKEEDARNYKGISAKNIYRKLKNKPT